MRILLSVIEKGTELGIMVEMYQNMDTADQKRILGYMQALQDRKKGNCSEQAESLADEDVRT